MLLALVQRRDRVVGKDELLACVWPNLVVEENNLQVHISTLRKLLGPEAITTVQGHGYRFTLADEGTGQRAGQPFIERRRNLRTGASGHTSTGQHEHLHLVSSSWPPIDPSASNNREVVPNNLPTQLTSFIGRDCDTRAVEALMTGSRLITLTGSGGCGKTRLSLRVAGEMLGQFRDGARFVELAPLADAALVPRAVATTMRVTEAPHKSLVDSLVEHLANKQLLLVLDNCEHLLDACAKLVDAVLRACPGVKILASSRERLAIDGEQSYRVPSMSLPDLSNRATADSVSRSESPMLFIDRARSRNPYFELTDDNAHALASLCCHLDGIPLAIELAAARTGSLSIEEIDRRLDRRFDLLTGGSRIALARHQTLRALIDWSYDLLSETEQRLLQLLSVFAGGWTLEAAEAVCSDEFLARPQIVDWLASLADKSLLYSEERDGLSRHRLLDTVRQYAQEKLQAAGCDASVRDRHLDYFLALAEASEQKMTGPEDRQWIRRLETEHENLRAALAWRFTQTASLSDLRLCAAMRWFWMKGGYYAEGRQWCRRMLDKLGNSDSTQERGRALLAFGVMCVQQGDFKSTEQSQRECLTIMRKLGDAAGTADTLALRANVARQRCDFPSAQALHEEALSIRREIGDRRGVAASMSNLAAVFLDQGIDPSAEVLVRESLDIAREVGDSWVVAVALERLGVAALFRNEYAESRSLLERSLAMRRDERHEWGIARALDRLGTLTFEEGDHAAARILHSEALLIQRALGDRPGIAFSLEGLAEVIASHGTPGRAVRIWGAVELLRSDTEAPLPPIWQPRRDRIIAATRKSMSDEALFDRCWQSGRSLTLDQAMDLALECMADETRAGMPAHQEQSINP